MMPNIWVLVANASTARLLKAKRIGGPLKLLEAFAHPQSREKGVDLVADRPGHYKSKGTGRGALVESTDPKATEAVLFSRELAESLNEGRNANAYERLVLVAPPQFLGLIKKHCNNNALELIQLTLEKDYTATTERDLANLLETHRP